jgi:ADP-heptose:LPS heptosyltransferase
MIGDYLLFRNTLSLYKKSVQYSKYKITLLGNISWKELFEAFDSSFVDYVIWVDKKKYSEEDSYRFALWKQLRIEGFSTAICPERERPLLLNDICTIASNAPEKIGANNCKTSKKINRLSNSFFDQLFTGDHSNHEFEFNKKFAKWLLGETLLEEKPFIINSFEKQTNASPYILCCIGAAHKSRRWPIERWVELIKLSQKEGLNNFKFVIAGGTSETNSAEKILKECGDGVISIVGKIPLTEFIAYVAGCTVLIGNDSMSVHVAVSCNKPTIILSNGNNYPRFTTYKELGLKNVITVYTDIFLNKIRRLKSRNSGFNFIPVTKDIASIQSNQVLEALKGIMPLV